MEKILITGALGQLGQEFINYFKTKDIYIVATDIKDPPDNLQCIFEYADVLNKDKSLVFGSGSVSGVDLLKFKPNTKVKLSLRKKLKISPASFIFVFIGRLNYEKGIYDLIDSFILADLKSAYLLIIGPDEENISSKFKGKQSNIIFSDITSSPQDFLAISNVLCLPSYREGFGNIVIEAAAIGLPSIVSNIYG